MHRLSAAQIPAVLHRDLRADLDHTVGGELEKAKTESRRYAKRQMTWLRRFMQDWQWFPNAAAAVSATRP